MSKNLVIIPTYNEESIIEKNLCEINGLLNEENYEIIIVDNGSTDQTINVIKNYKVKMVIEKERTIGGLRNLVSTA